MDELDPRPVSRHDMSSLVCGAVVDDDEFEILKSLAQNAVDRLSEKTGAIVGSDDNRYRGWTGHGLTFWTHAVDFDLGRC